MICYLTIQIRNNSASSVDLTTSTPCTKNNSPFIFFIQSYQKTLQKDKETY